MRDSRRKGKNKIMYREALRVFVQQRTLPAGRSCDGAPGVRRGGVVVVGPVLVRDDLVGDREGGKRGERVHRCRLQDRTERFETEVRQRRARSVSRALERKAEKPRLRVDVDVTRAYGLSESRHQ